jgi:RHS repeat-associated protein
MGNGTTARYQYDASGNRTQLAYGGQTFVNTINPASNQLQKTTGPLPVKTNVYDAAGNLASDGTITYLYNARGRLQSAQSGAITATYHHNGLDQRAVKIVKMSSSVNAPVETTHFIYDESGRLIGEYDTNGALIQETVYLGYLPIAIFKSGKINEPAHQGIYYIYSDHLNTPRVITDSMDNQIVWRWDLTDPFGASQPVDAVQGRGTFSYNLRFPGQYYDRETNLHYNYFRDYDPQMGRYVQSDPIGLEAGINTYVYVFANPLSYVDPKGLDIWIEGPSKNEPSFHQSVNVGNPNGSYSSYSYGMNGHGLEGQVYRDVDLGGPFEAYKKTSAVQDAVFKAAMEGKLGEKGTYGYDDICRSWSQRQYNNAPGFSVAPPHRLSARHFNVTPSSSRSPTGASSTTGTGTSQ